MLGVAAQRIAWPIRKPRNNADECHCAETRRDGGFPGDLLCRAARPWGLPRASRRFAHLIPESLRRGHAGLIQRFPNFYSPQVGMDLQLTGKLALVSGSTAGIGYAIAEALAREGARVIVNGRTQAAVDASVAKLKATTGGAPSGFAGDLAEAAVAEALARRHPDVEILVNNLGTFEVKAFEEITDADWRRFFDTNVLSGARLAR